VSTTASSTPNFNGTRPWLAFSPGVLTASRMGHGGSITQHGGYPALQVDYNAFMSRCDAALCNYASTQGPTPLEVSWVLELMYSLRRRISPGLSINGSPVLC
jgi:hypothetical protein